MAFVQYDRTEAYVAAVADVEVNPMDGKVRVQRVFIAHDCGLIINPRVGAGEATNSAIPAAIANAIFDATGIRLRTVPFTPERVKANFS